jgi:hypothetical protein
MKIRHPQPRRRLLVSSHFNYVRFRRPSVVVPRSSSASTSVAYLISSIVRLRLHRASARSDTHKNAPLRCPHTLPHGSSLFHWSGLQQWPWGWLLTGPVEISSRPLHVYPVVVEAVLMQARLDLRTLAEHFRPVASLYSRSTSRGLANKPEPIISPPSPSLVPSAARLGRAAMAQSVFVFSGQAFWEQSCRLSRSQILYLRR